MSINHWGHRESQGTEVLSDSGSSTLEQKVSSALTWSRRVFEISDLQVEPVRMEKGLFLSTLQLNQLAGDSGETQNPVHPVQLSFKAEGKEMSLLSSLLGRHCSILELKLNRLIHQNQLLSEVQELRVENQNLRQEVQNLYEALDRLQRPRLVS